MCDTKQEIASGFKLLMKEKPIKKITVQDLMDALDRKRQSFYYHFQDVYDVMEWICYREFISQIKYQEEQSFEEWFDHALSLLESDRLFYKKVIECIDRNRIVTELLPSVEAQVRRLMRNDYFDGPIRKKTKEMDSMIRFVSNSIIYHIIEYVDRRGNLKPQEIRYLVNYSLKALKFSVEYKSEEHTLAV
ncbi:MAG: hypothetical protein ACERKN_12910 [Velocimicrobium sp.]